MFTEGFQKYPEISGMLITFDIIRSSGCALKRFLYFSMQLKRNSIKMGKKLFSVVLNEVFILEEICYYRVPIFLDLEPSIWTAPNFFQLNQNLTSECLLI